MNERERTENQPGSAEAGSILITGAAGWTARPLLERLRAAGHRPIGLDIDGRPEYADGFPWIRADVGDLAAVESACQADIAAVAHLAVAIGQGDYGGPDIPFRSNVLGTYNVLEAARRARVQRIVLLSSATVHLPPPSVKSPYAWRSSGGADHLYDLTKRLQEEIGRDFSETFDIDVVVLRAGHVVDSLEGRDRRGRPLDEVTYCRGGWVCRHDVARAVERALQAPLRGFHVFNIVGSAGARERFDVDSAERQLGFSIGERFENYDGDLE
jgi:nucleoside-diphosphate-sugar epimerase